MHIAVYTLPGATLSNLYYLLFVAELKNKAISNPDSAQAAG